MKPKHWFLLFVAISVFYPTPFLILTSLAITALLLAVVFSPLLIAYRFFAGLTDDTLDKDGWDDYYPSIL